MAKLYGRLKGNRGETTRVGHKVITARLETWEGSVEVLLGPDGDFGVWVGDKDNPSTCALQGNVNERPVTFDLHGSLASDSDDPTS